MKQKNVYILGFLAVVALLAAAFVYFNRNESINMVGASRSALTGLEVSEEKASRPVLGVMIENSEAARPQTGLDSAGIVFESVTEGGITRFLALYQEDMPEEVGPIRSLRKHFLDWAMGFDVSIAHIGGSREALDLVKERDAKSLNQFRYSKPYFRDSSRSAPHNAYARTKDLRDLQDRLDHSNSSFDPIPRSEDAPSASPSAPRVRIDFSSPAYQVEFRYDQTKNSYTRFLAGSPHIDAATNQPITVKNVVVIKTQGLEAGVDAIGSGEAIVFKDGNVQTVRWEKDKFSQRIKIIDDQNNEVPLNRGDTWFAVIAKDRSVDF